MRILNYTKNTCFFNDIHFCRESHRTVRNRNKKQSRENHHKSQEKATAVTKTNKKIENKIC